MRHTLPLLLMSAGASSRMGEPKGLLRLNNKTWLEQQLESVQNTGLSRVFLVLGSQLGLYFKALPWLEKSVGKTQSFERLKITTLINPTPERGYFSSIQIGADAILQNN